MRVVIHLRRAVIFALAFMTLACMLAANATVSQQPLLHRAAGSDKPNLVLTLDDSSSMGLRHLPDDVSAFKDARRWRQGFHPADAPGAAMRSDVSAAAMTYTTRTGDVWSARMRSASINRLYYDPAVTYQPWVGADGTALADADPSAALFDPLVTGTVAQGLAVNLRGEQVWTAAALWCRADPDPAVDPRNGPLCDAIAGERFAPATYYRSSGFADWDAAGFTRVRIMDSTSFLNPASRIDCVAEATGARCSREKEYRNFANWFVYHRTRLYAAISATSRALASQEDMFRLGYGRTGKATPSSVDGELASTLVRGVRHFSGADRRDFFDWLHRLRAASDTPLRRAMDDVGRYYSRAQATDAGSPWADTPWLAGATAHSACRRAYHLLVTDGAWNGAEATTPAARANVDGALGPLITHADGVRNWRYQPAMPWRDDTASTLADVALHYYARDLHPGAVNAVPLRAENDLFWQGMINLTVGFGVGGTLDATRDLEALKRGNKVWPRAAADQPSAVDDLWHAALNSGGRHLDARNAAGLESALSAVLEDVRPVEVTTAGVALSSSTPDGSRRKYVAGYRTEDWSGDVTAYNVDATGSTGGTLWSASERLPAYGLRDIWTWDSAGRKSVRFKWPQLVAAGIEATLGPTADASLVDYLRGDRSQEGARWRKRAGALGDVVNSQPVLIDGSLDLQYDFLPAGADGRETYRAFVSARKSRARMLAFGANDGMLHLLRESDGQEIFAFMPGAVLSSVAQLARPGYQHRFFVDGPVALADAWWSGQWRSVVVGTAGAGAASVFALDVSEPESLGATSVLWEYNAADDAELGRVLAARDAGLMRSGHWAAVFGNGYDSASGAAKLVVLNLKTGRLIRSLQVGAMAGPVGTAANGLGGARLVRDANNVVIAAYAGDLQGRLWRFDLNSANPADWKVAFNGVPLFTAIDDAGLPRPITAAPEYIDHPQGGQLVLVGTGKLFEVGDLASTQVQSVYGLWDKTAATSDAAAAGTIGSQAQLARHAFDTVAAMQADTAAAAVTYDTVRASPVDWSRQRGWMLPLPERMRDVYGPSFQKSFVRFHLVAPALPDLHGCGETFATGLDVQLQPLTGDMPPSAIFDTNGDGMVDGSDLRVAGVRVSGEAPGRFALDRRMRGALIDSRKQAVQVDYGAQKLVRHWRQILNFPR